MQLIYTLLLAASTVSLVALDEPIGRRREREGFAPAPDAINGLGVAASTVSVVAACLSVARELSQRAVRGDDLAIAINIVAFVGCAAALTPALWAVRPKNAQTIGTWLTVIAYFAAGGLLVASAANDLIR